MKVIEAKTRFQAWFEAFKYLHKIELDFNLILSIEQPMIEDKLEKESNDIIEKYYIEENEYPIHTVAETIFPGWEYKKHGLTGVYNYPNQIYPRLKSSNPTSWGTYAYRILRRENSKREFINPLENLINKMKNVVSNTKSSNPRSCYEININEGEFDIPLYQTTVDHGRRRGLPCLSHLSFKLDKGKLHLTAIYRSHDYRLKVPGNLLGLARLQSCIAKEVGIKSGTMVIHSTYAYIDRGNKKRLTQIINEIESIIDKKEVA